MAQYTNEDGVIFEDVEFDSDVCKELLRTYKVKPKDKESAFDYTRRVLKRSASGSDDEWNELSESTQAWVNGAQEGQDKCPEEFPLLILDAAEETSEDASDSEDEEESTVENEGKPVKAANKAFKKIVKVLGTKAAGKVTKEASKASEKVSKAVAIKVTEKATKAAAKARKKTNGGVRGEKIKLIVGLLTRKGGCTARDVLDATGWPAVSMPAMAKQAGLTLNKKKVQGESTVYSAKASG